METIIIDYGAGNVFSVATALERLGVRSALTSDPDVIRRAERVIFPGVGQAGQAMERLVRTGLDEVIPRLTVPDIPPRCKKIRGWSKSAAHGME